MNEYLEETYYRMYHDDVNDHSKAIENIAIMLRNALQAQDITKPGSYIKISELLILAEETISFIFKSLDEDITNHQLQIHQSNLNETK